MFIVMSDSHTNRETVKKIKEKYEGTASALFHCGDSELPSNDEIWKGITVVSGNCDYDDGYSEVKMVEVEGKKVLIAHGHQFYVGFGLERYSYFAEEKEADIALFGHIHQPVAQIIGKTLFINPGSVSQPRGEINIKMYAVVTIFNNGYNVSYHDLEHKKIPDLQFTFNL
ncbi:metallophosphoesterase [Lactococcus ileimucosae]|uniref:metallophosphoesterase n=1 Tax=Lactococcus ileimucosae TaxID=2941329 RepID=UPI0020448AF0|nr:metallophosphoesterase [Lactococcus ileimucosae]